jgi:cytidine deaminase
METRADRFKSVLRTFPFSVQPYLEQMAQQGGELSQKTCDEVTRLLDVSVEKLMIRLLPLAKVFSMASVSNFHVGAVAMANTSSTNGPTNLYLGANMEFEHLALNMSIHAEQSAVMSAWFHGARLITAIATSETPCGYCRQFLQELCGGTDLMILKPVGEGYDYRTNRLSEIFPAAFSPMDLGNDSGFLAAPKKIRKLRLVHPSDDPVVQAALSAAVASYAPYTGNFSGCAFQTPGGEIINGSYMESVAYNPSISPLHSAILRLNMMTLAEKQAIDRIVLVEKPTRIRQKDLVEMLVGSWAQNVELEYYIAQEEVCV